MSYVRKSIGCILALGLLYCTAAQATPISNDELFDRALLGVDLRNPTAPHIYQKYETTVSCFTGSAGMYINSAKKLMYIGYSFDPVSDAFAAMGDVFDPIGDAYDPVGYTFQSIVNSDEIGELLVLSISSIQLNGDSIIIAATSVEHGKFLFRFTKTDENILTLTLVSAPPPVMGYESWGFGEAYTNANDEPEYYADDCEGFQG